MTEPNIPAQLPGWNPPADWTAEGSGHEKPLMTVSCKTCRSGPKRVDSFVGTSGTELQPVDLFDW